MPNEIKFDVARLTAADAQRLLDSAVKSHAPIELAETWDVMNGVFGKKTYTLSEADNDENVVLMFEVKAAFIYWHVSPPGYDERDYKDGSLRIAEYTDREAALEECKRLCLEGYAEWCALPDEDRESEDAEGVRNLESLAADLARSLILCEQERDVALAHLKKSDEILYVT